MWREQWWSSCFCFHSIDQRAIGIYTCDLVWFCVFKSVLIHKSCCAFRVVQLFVQKRSLSSQESQRPDVWCGHMIVRPARLIQFDYWKFSFMWSTRTWQRLSSSVSSRMTLHLSLWAIFQICFSRFYKHELLLYSTVKRDRREVVSVGLFLANPKPLMTSLCYIPDTPDQEFPSESQQPFLQVSQNLHECINIHLWVSEYSLCHAELFHTAVLLKGKSVRPSGRCIAPQDACSLWPSLQA